MELFSGRKNTIGMPNLLEKFLLVARYLMLDNRYQILVISTTNDQHPESRIQYLKKLARQSCLFYCIYLFKQVKWFIGSPFGNFH
jgi:hypothetical protein